MKQFNNPAPAIIISAWLKNARQSLKAVVLIFCMTGFISFAQSQTTFTAVQAGQWNDPDTWDMGAVPTAADDVVVGSGITVLVASVAEACNTLVIGMGDGSGSGTVTFSGVSSLTVTGTILMGDINGATGTITMDAAAVLTCGTIEEADPGYSGIYETNTGMMIFNGSFTLPFNLFQFHDLVVNGGTLTTGGRNLPIEGDLTINSGATLDLGVNTANRNTIAGTFTVADGATLRIGGGGTIPANFSTHVIGATSTIEYYGVSQTVATLNSSQNYGNLIISGSGLKEVNGAIGISRDLTVNSGIFSVNTFSANRTSAGGTLTVANGATLRIAGSGTIPSNYSTHVVGATSTIEYSGTSAQTVAVLNSSQKYGHLNVYNAFKTLGGDITVAGTLTFGGTPNKLIIGSNTLTLEGQISGSLTGSRNFMGSTTSNLVMKGAFNRTLFFDATTVGTTNVLNNLTINHNGNISTLGNDLVLNGALTFTAGKLSIAARTLTLKGNLVNTVTGGIRGSTSSKIIFNGNVSPVLSMDLTTAGTTNALSTLQVNSSGQTVTMGTDLVMSSTLTFTAGKLAINGNTLTLKGLVTNTVAGGIVGGSTSNLIINGTVSPSLSFDQTTPGTTNVIRNLTVNSSGQTATLSNALRLVGTHTPTAGVFASGGNYTVASTATGTANIAAGSTSGGYITGAVTVERYIPQNTNRAWRLLASPTNGQTIHEAWQENQAAGVNGVPGFGTNITTKELTWAADGYDFYTPNYSLYAYDAATDELVPVSSTSSAIANEPGYFIYIRGNRSVTPSASVTSMNSTTLRTKGTLYMGNQSAVSVDADKFALVGNPYASAIDLRNVATSGGCTGTSFYVWDPKLMGAYSIGAFQTFTPSGGNYVVIPGGGSYGSSGTVVNTIQSGAAFMVQATGSTGTVTINESSKTSGSSVVFRPGGISSDKNLFTNLYAVSAGVKNIADGNMLFFNDAYSNTVDAEDSRKQLNFGENLGIARSGNELVVERRTNPVANDTIPFMMHGLKRMTYELQLFGDRLQDNTLLAFLDDKYLHTQTFINLDDTTRYSFTVDANAGSGALSRFSIVFKSAGILPVSFTSVKAYQQSAAVAVEWQVANQVNRREYKIEKSINGKAFVTAGTVAALSNDALLNYKWLDVNPVQGANYYRIKSVDVNGKFVTTPIVKVILGDAAPLVTVSPNPVEAGVMNLQFVKQVKGNYSVRLINSAGQVVFSRTLNHEGGSASQTIALPAQVVSGSYQLEVTAPGNTRKTQVVIISNH
jgi:hypothetical protein